MEKIKDLVMYGGFAGGGSIGLVYFIPTVWRSIAIISIMGMSILLAVQSVISDSENSTFRLQLAPTRRPAGSDADVDSDGPVILYYMFGVLLFGSVTLVLFIN